MAAPHENAYPAVRGRVRARRIAKATGAGMMSVAAVTVVAAGALYEPPHDMGYAPGIAGFTSAPNVLGLGPHGEAHLMLEFQPPGWEGSAIACGAPLPPLERAEESPPPADDGAAGDDGAGSGGGGDYGLRISAVQRDTLEVSRTRDASSDDVLAGPVSYVWTQDGLVVSLPVDAVQDAELGLEEFTRYDTPSTRSACLGHDSKDQDGDAPTAEPPELPAGTYQVRAYQYLVPTGSAPDAGSVDAAIEDPASWSDEITVELTEDGAILPSR
ncbi:hypothetical protein GCM10028784_13060 [Myceligenerans cantabricum]